MTNLRPHTPATLSELIIRVYFFFCKCFVLAFEHIMSVQVLLSLLLSLSLSLSPAAAMPKSDFLAAEPTSHGSHFCLQAEGPHCFCGQLNLKKNSNDKGAKNVPCALQGPGAPSLSTVAVGWGHTYTLLYSGDTEGQRWR